MKRLSIIVCAIALWLSQFTTYTPILAEEKDNEEFEQFMMDEFLDTLESDYLNMHFTVSDYHNWNIEKPELIFADATLGSYNEAIEENQRILKELEQFDYNSLSSRQQYDYDVLHKYLIDNTDMNRYPMLDSYFNPNSGVLDNIITNFTEFVFRREEDIQDYLVILKDVQTFLRDAIELTQQQASQGIFLTDTLLDETEAFITKFTEKKEDNALIVVFDEQIDTLDFLDNAQKEAYKKENKDIVLNTIIPAYRMVGEELEKLRGSNRYEGGVANYPNGKEYYAALARYKSSADKSIEEELKNCEEFLKEVVDLYMTTTATDSAWYAYMFEQVDLSTPEQTLKYLENHLDAYPKGPEVTYKGTYLDPSVTNDAVVAYYMEPPIDNIKENVIKINGDSVSDMNGLYETLAHEGFPGHLYQITWYLNTNPNPLRAVLSNIGYTEGWAMYTETQSWATSGLDGDVAMLHALETAMGYVMDAYVDLGVNGLGWDLEKTEDELERIGLSGSSAELLYDFVVSRPGMIVPYGYGMVEFYRLRGKATTALGDDFDEVEFHEVLLTNGDRPFELVEKDVDAYIASKGKAIPTNYKYFNDFAEYFDKKASGPSQVVPSIGGNTQSGETPEETPIHHYNRPASQFISPVIMYGLIGLFAFLAIFAILRLRKHGKENPFA